MFHRLKVAYWMWRADRKFLNAPKSKAMWLHAKITGIPIHEVKLTDPVDLKGLPEVTDGCEIHATRITGEKK